MSSIFSHHILDDYGLPRTVHCADLEVTDRVFNALNNMDFKLIDRDWEVWRDVFPPRVDLAALPTPVPFYQFQQTLLSAPPSAPPTTPASSVRALTPESPASGVEEDFEEEFLGAPPADTAYVLEELANRTTITTTFNPRSKTNQRRPFPGPGPKRERWTLRQRGYASKAARPETVEELQEQLQNTFYSRGGIKSTKNSYVRVAPSIFEGKDVLIEGRDSSLLCLILGDMPADLRQSLELSIETCMGARSSQPLLRPIQSPDKLAEFVTVHFSHYMRMGQDGYDAPRHVHPWFLKRTGVARTNHAQMTPYESKEMLDNFVEYDALCNALDQLRAHLGDLYFEIACYADEIPGRKASPCHPFAGFVLNFNIATKGHRDSKDLKACLVLPIGIFTGGELCLVEPGLVLPLRSGDVMVFPSCDITHFNLTYTGTRASLVCHSDRDGLKWVGNKMGWRGNSYLDDERA
ncbi:hypothetical protein GSI_00690 [Ganoderma sinense ZZ0214-1]|uniref:Uncharacterized protein n=1 Tax=Ganoderma sinense ZZ0214-1 TaxID=1077348 RepID=A0A2G8STV3_9APHY|nr:hypothetical protein GSI_00690 [Ganoderma sinense ZZ0214-1]